MVEVSIRGWKNAGRGDPGIVLDFLRNKIEGTLDVVSTRVVAEDLLVKVRSVGEATNLQRLSGVRFSGAKLSIRIMGRLPASTSDSNIPQTQSNTSNVKHPSSIETLTAILRSRYNPSIKFLNLSALESDPTMLSHPSLSGFGSDYNDTLKIGPVICKLIGELFPDVQTISFESNRLSTLKCFASLPKWAPLLQNLSFRDNLIGSFAAVEGLKLGGETPNLRELFFVGNPIWEREKNKPGGEAEYRRKIKDMFPSLQVLDQMDFEEEISFGLPTDTLSTAGNAFPETEKGAFMDTPVSADMVQDFIRRFFPLFDKNRGALMDLYADNATFSVSVNTMPRRGGGSGSGPDRGGKRREYFDKWMSYNRNHVTTKDLSKRLSLLASTPSAIIQVFGKLPVTEHPTNASPEKQMFISDAFQLPLESLQGGVALVVTIHGEFHEVEIHKSRSFSRTLILLPAPPNSRAAMNGWAYTILNDVLTVRSWSPERVWVGKEPHGLSAKPSVGSLIGDADVEARRAQRNAERQIQQMQSSQQQVQPGGMSLLSQQQQQQQQGQNLPADPSALEMMKTKMGLNDQQHQLVLQVAQASGLNYQFAAQCLNETQWDGNQAMEAFNAARANIPPEASKLLKMLDNAIIESVLKVFASSDTRRSTVKKMVERRDSGVDLKEPATPQPEAKTKSMKGSFFKAAGKKFGRWMEERGMKLRTCKKAPDAEVSAATTLPAPAQEVVAEAEVVTSHLRAVSDDVSLQAAATIPAPALDISSRTLPLSDDIREAILRVEGNWIESWYSDTSIMLILKPLMDAKGIFLVDPTLMGFEPTMECDSSTYAEFWYVETFVVPVNLNGNHWILVTGRKTPKNEWEVRVWDSMRKGWFFMSSFYWLQVPNLRKWIDHFTGTHLPFRRAKLARVPRQQCDTICGGMVVESALRFAANYTDFPKSITTVPAYGWDLRARHVQLILRLLQIPQATPSLPEDLLSQLLPHHSLTGEAAEAWTVCLKTQQGLNHTFLWSSAPTSRRFQDDPDHQSLECQVTASELLQERFLCATEPFVSISPTSRGKMETRQVDRVDTNSVQASNNHPKRQSHLQSLLNMINSQPEMTLDLKLILKKGGLPPHQHGQQLSSNSKETISVDSAAISDSPLTPTTATAVTPPSLLNAADKDSVFSRWKALEQRRTSFLTNAIRLQSSLTPSSSAASTPTTASFSTSGQGHGSNVAVRSVQPNIDSTAAKSGSTYPGTPLKPKDTTLSHLLWKARSSNDLLTSTSSSSSNVASHASSLTSLKDPSASRSHATSEDHLAHHQHQASTTATSPMGSTSSVNTTTSASTNQTTSSTSHNITKFINHHVVKEEDEFHRRISLSVQGRQVVGDYIIDKTLGEGAFAKVKLATHFPTGLKVAVKCIQTSKIDTLLRPRLLRELLIHSHLQHPHITRLLQIIDTPTTLYLVMEHESGGELFDYLVSKKEGRLDENEARRFWRELCSAVGYLHLEHGISHRDLKPENLLLSSTNHLKLIDFGFSTLQPPSPALLNTFCGSPQYAAPEMIIRKDYNGFKVDLWAMGVILFAMLFGELPFDDRNLRKMFVEIAKGRFTFPESVDVSEDAKSIITSLLNPNPELRPSISDLLTHPFTTASSTLPPPSIKPSPSHSDFSDAKIWAEVEGLGYAWTEIQNSIREEKLRRAGEEANGVGGVGAVEATYWLLKSKKESPKKKKTKKGSEWTTGQLLDKGKLKAEPEEVDMVKPAEGVSATVTQQSKEKAGSRQAVLPLIIEQHTPTSAQQDVELFTPRSHSNLPSASSAEFGSTPASAKKGHLSPTAQSPHHLSTEERNYIPISPTTHRPLVSSPTPSPSSHTSTKSPNTPTLLSKLKPNLPPSPSASNPTTQHKILTFKSTYSLLGTATHILSLLKSQGINVPASASVLGPWECTLPSTDGGEGEDNIDDIEKQLLRMLESAEGESRFRVWVDLIEDEVV
ncbi:Protein kinase, partial [Chytridiales sp. JEL 0842]